MSEIVVQPRYTSPEGLEPADYAYIDLVMGYIRQAPAAFEKALQGMITQETTFDKGRVANPINFSERRPEPPLPLSPKDLILDLFGRRLDRGFEFDAATEAAIGEHPLYQELHDLRDNTGRELLAVGKMGHDMRESSRAKAYGTAMRLARFAIFAQQMQLRGAVPKPRSGDQDSSAA